MDEINVFKIVFIIIVAVACLAFGVACYVEM